MIVYQYRIVEQRDALSLERQVNALIGAGWQPVGGVTVASSGVGMFVYAQAVVQERPGV